MCFGGGGAKSTKPPEPTPATRFDYRAGEQSRLDQQRGVANVVAAPKPAPLGSDLAAGSSASLGNAYDVNYGAGGAP
jgi:hypothetical protein